MALVADRVLEGSTTTGTGNFTLTGAFAGHRSFNAAFASASSVLYCIEDGVNWEVGVGTFTAPSTLVRSTVQSSSNGGSLVDFPVGAKRVFNTYTASSLAPASGGASGLEMTVSTTTTDADPGTGVIRWNNSTQASATSLFIDNADSNSASLATLWASTAAGAFLKIVNAADSDNWQLWKVTTVTSASGYYKFAVTLQASSGAAFANAIAVLLDVDEAGNGSASPTTTKGDLIVRGTSADQRLAAPSVDDYRLAFDLASGLPVWKAPSDGSGGVIGSNAFSVYRGTSNQVPSASTYTKVQLNAETDDTANAFDSVTNFRFQPQVAGYYAIAGAVWVSASGLTSAHCAIYKNGSVYKYGAFVPPVGGVAIPTCADVIHFNGSSDYVELYGYASGGSGQAFEFGPEKTYLSGALLSTTASGVPRVAAYSGGTTAGDVITSSTSYADLPFSSLSIPASVGDEIELTLFGLATGGTTELRLKAQANSVDVGYETVSQLVTGYARQMELLKASFVVTSAHLSGGVVPLKVKWKSQGGGDVQLRDSATNQYLVVAKNFGDGSGVPARASRGVLPIASSTSIVIDGRSFDNFRVSALAHNTTIADPINMTDGQSGMLRIKQDGTGGRTIAFSSKWKRIGDAVTLVTTAGAMVVISYEYDATDDTVVYAIQNVA